MSGAELISADFPFIKSKVSVLGLQMSFVDVGSTQQPYVAVFLHGNPTSSYLWRNIIPHISTQMRCIAPDLVGFGDSDKVPGLAYRIRDHIKYLDAFMDVVLPTENILLIVHDWGSALGFDWARRHEARIVGLVFMEFLPPSNSWSEFRESFTNLFQQFRTAELGRSLIIDQNLFVEQVLPRAVVRPLSSEEMDHYRRPFLLTESREPVYRFPNELPIEGQPADVWSIAQAYMSWLLESELPKLMFWVTPGTFVSKARANALTKKLRNTRSIYLGEGVHYIQEDYPHKIGQDICNWFVESVKGFL